MERPATAGWMLDTRDFSGTFGRRTNEMLTVLRSPFLKDISTDKEDERLQTEGTRSVKGV